MKKIQYVLISLLLVGCAKEVPLDTAFTEDTLKPYVTEFFKLAGENGSALDVGRISKLTVAFDDKVVYPILGSCSVGTSGYKIRVNPTTWAYLSIAEREQLMFHELGHCLIGLQHDDSRARLYDFTRQLPGSYEGRANLMSTYAFFGEWYASNRNYYVQKLFNFNTPQPAKMYYNGPSQFNENIYK